MTINRTTLLDLPLPVTGTESGTWGDITNNGLAQYVDIAVAGMNSLTSSDFTAGALTISNTQGDSGGTNIAAGSAQYATIKVSSLAANSTITAPASNRSYRIINADSTYSLTIKASGQTGITFLPGQTGVVAFTGTDYEVVGVVNAASSTDNAVPKFDGTTGQIIQNTGVTIDDSNNVSGVAQLNATTADLTNIEVTNIKAKDGTAAGSIANSTGVVTLASSVLTTTDINAGTIDATAIGGSTPAAGAFTTLSSSSDATLHGLTVGQGAGSVSTNTAVGASALAANTTGANNVAVGYQALDANTTGQQNTAVGSSALGANTTGSFNVALGRDALKTNTTADYNTGLGYQALDANTTGSENTAVGFYAGLLNTTGTLNSALGSQALRFNTTGGSNTAIGQKALYANTTASNNTAVGTNALTANTTGANNTAVGYGALDANTTGVQNVAVGSNALGANTTGSYNVAVGHEALVANTTGTLNTAIGHVSLDSNTTGSNNVALGFNTLGLNTTGANNTAVGHNALGVNTTGNYNTALGAASQDSTTSGINNSSYGYNSLQAVTTGRDNTVGGVSAGIFISTGEYNTALGSDSAKVLTTGSFNIYIGQNTSASATNVSQEYVIGAGGVTGKGSNTFYTSGANSYNGGNTTTWATTSDQRLKKNIVDNNEGLEKINGVRVRNFEYRLPEEVTDLPEHTAIQKTGVQLGVIAQELQQVCPDCVTEQSTGVLSVNTDELFWHMVNAIKELSTQVTALQAEVNTLKGQ